jgi:hypothetical protein
MDFIPGQCLLSHVEVLANFSPDTIASAIGYGLRSTKLSERFPNLKSPLVRDLNLIRVILRNGWNEDRWSEEARPRRNIWNAGLKLVEDVFKE